MDAWRNATKQKPTHVNAWFNTIVLYDNLNDFINGEKAVKDALRYLPNSDAIYFQYSIMLGKQEKFEDGEKNMLKAISLNPSSKYYGNLGILYHRWKKYKKAENAYQKCLQLDPNNTEMRKNYQMLVNLMKKRKQ